MAEQKRMFVPLHLDAKASGLQPRQFRGHGATFDLDRGGDRIAPGAFRKTLAEYQSAGRWPPMLWGHDMSRVCGRWLDMKEDRDGLAVVGELVKTPLGDEVHELLKTGAVSGMSIGYVARDADFDRDGVRILREIELLELSVVAVPMNDSARVVAAKAEFDHIRKWERHLQTVGFSKRQAVRLASKTWGVIAAELEIDPEQALKDIAVELREQQAIAALLASANTIRGL